MEFASNVLEGAQNLKNNIITHVSNLFSGDEGMTMKNICGFKVNKTANWHFDLLPISILFLFLFSQGLFLTLTLIP